MKRALAVVVLAALWIPVKVIGLLDDIAIRYDADALDEWAER